MQRLLLTAALVSAAALTLDHLQVLEARIAELEQVPRVEVEHTRELARRLDNLRRSLEEARVTFESDDRADALAAELVNVSKALERERCAIAAQDERLDDWEQHWGDRQRQSLEGKLDALSADLGRRQRDLDELRALASRTSEQGEERLLALSQQVQPLLAEPDTHSLWHELVGPVAQLSGDTTVGSGVLLESQRRTNGEGYVTHVLTSWHVVRDIYGSLERIESPVPVRLYEPDGGTTDETAHMVAYDVGLDIALLEMDFDRQVPHGARLASHDELGRVDTFDAIYAVGCPLGNDPIPTSGEVASTTHVVDGVRYWMISAPTYIGNSGGGIFDARTHKLIGIFSKIYTHGSARSTIVPHMGLATPLPVIYEWLDRTGHASLLSSHAAPRTAAALR
ncbi:MAG: hypothetical protein FJ298_08585 [Planctomycetes bacterium]|nr:hypothetical protein [Planctomycetota bacterium]